MPQKSEEYKCGFCKKPSSEVKTIIASGTKKINICNECVIDSYNMLEDSDEYIAATFIKPKYKPEQIFYKISQFIIKPIEYVYLCQVPHHPSFHILLQDGSLPIRMSDDEIELLYDDQVEALTHINKFLTRAIEVNNRTIKEKND